MAVVAEAMGPPRMSVGVFGWLKKNLFSTWFNTLLTLAALWLVYVVGGGILNWALNTAKWNVVIENLRLLMAGPYPVEQLWRVWATVLMVSALFGLSAGAWGGILRSFAFSLAGAYALLALFFDGDGRAWMIANVIAALAGFAVSRGRVGLRRGLVAAWFLSFFVTIILLQGFENNSFLPQVGTDKWGGLLLTFILAIVSIVLSFPLGVLLALGRRSQLPAIRWVSTAYIEVVRGVPLVTILFMAQIMVPLFFPEDMRLDRVVRAIAGMTLFTAAYVAENVRGGLQAIPDGQVEAAKAVGLNNALITLLIVLPQALRIVIPANVNTFIGIFKDTTLVSIVGLLDLLAIGKSVLAQPEFLGLYREVYFFISAVFFVFCYAMATASYRLETALGLGKR